MVKRCIYCSTKVASDCVVDMCQRCMYQVWGEKMAKAIVEGMEKERDAGNMDLGQVGKEVEKSFSEIEDVNLEADSTTSAENLISDVSIIEEVVENKSPELEVIDLAEPVVSGNECIVDESTSEEMNSSFI